MTSKISLIRYVNKMPLIFILTFLPGQALAIGGRGTEGEGLSKLLLTFIIILGGGGLSLISFLVLILLIVFILSRVKSIVLNIGIFLLGCFNIAAGGIGLHIIPQITGLHASMDKLMYLSAYFCLSGGIVLIIMTFLSNWLVESSPMTRQTPVTTPRIPGPQKQPKPQKTPSPGLVSAPGTRAADSYVGAFRFVAEHCIISEVGLQTVYNKSEPRKVSWEEITELVIVKLPPDKPFEGRIFFDIIPQPDAHGKVIPYRLFPTTRVNYSDLPAGAGQTSFENFRKLAHHIISHNSDITFEPPFKEFLEGKNPPGLNSIKQFSQYDTRFG
ncbi:hypothetical protein ACFL27_01540 [candidate division CSSED10-310 bacterium]|uniref:Uncharacterized protein n=1 Tax=candidate division CSSED10-310 bacterium TaxID=2855610 RepID=A0ABV6YRP9_UNCC1